MIVGVSMGVSYTVETRAEKTLSDDKSFDQISYVRFRYDLELDQEGRIIGGEWHDFARPDFIWTPDSERRALSNADALVQETGSPWKTDQKSIPEAWRPLIPEASKRGIPLGFIVEELIERSRLKKY